MSSTSLYNYLSNYPGQINDKQRAWLLEVLGLTSSTDALNDLWYKYLRSLGYLGDLTTMMWEWAGDKSGNTSMSLTDRMGSLPAYGSWIPVSGDYLLDDNHNYLTDELGNRLTA